MLRLSREKAVLRVVADQLVCPTPAASIAEATWQLSTALSNQPAWGTYHYCGDKPVSWHAFAEAIIGGDQHPEKLTQEIIAISTDKYPTRAKRPLYSVLDCSLLEKTFGIKAADWRQGLQDVIRELSTT
jgi:dTDP-4-dehydrorhamnose reductase